MNKLKDNNKKKSVQAKGGMSYYKQKLRNRIHRLKKRYSLLEQAKLTISDGIIYLETNSPHSVIEIFYKGQGTKFVNLLAPQHSIDIHNKRIFIRSIGGFKNPFGQLLKYYGDFSVISCRVTGYIGGSVEADVINNDSDIVINKFSTNVDSMDEILYYSEENVDKKGSSHIRPLLNENSIKGLWMNNNYYKGYYHYWPDLKIGATGFRPNINSVPIKAFKNINKINTKKIRNEIEKYVKFNKGKFNNIGDYKVNENKAPDSVKRYTENLKNALESAKSKFVYKDKEDLANQISNIANKIKEISKKDRKDSGSKASTGKTSTKNESLR